MSGVFFPMSNALRTFTCFVALCPAIALADEPTAKHNYRPMAGYVPDEVTAIRIAVAVWEPIYGRRTIAREKPYHAVLSDGVWTVEGSMPRLALGGVAVAEVRRSDGCVLRISHGQ